MPLELYESVCKSMQRCDSRRRVAQIFGSVWACGGGFGQLCSAMRALIYHAGLRVWWDLIGSCEWPWQWRNLNRAREPGQQCLSAKLLDVSAILGSGLMIQHKDTHPISCAINLACTHLCDPHLPVLYCKPVQNFSLKVQHKNTTYTMTM